MNPWYNSEILKETGSKMLSLISEFQNNVPTLPIKPTVNPGFLLSNISPLPPQKGTSLPILLKEIQDLIQPGLSLTNHPMYFAEMTGGINETTILAEIYINALHTPGFSWEASPAQTELENIVMDWFVGLLGLSEKFLIGKEGGGVLSTSTTHSYFHSINVAKYKKMDELKIDYTNEKTFKFVAYYPETTAKKSEKALKLKEVQHFRKIPMAYDINQKNYHINYELLEDMIKDDINKGLIPFWCDSNLGSEGVCNIDDIPKVASMCEKYGLSLNVNANWGGFFLMLEEFNELNKGLDKADFIIINGRYLMGGGYSSFTYFSSKEIFKNSLGGLMKYPMVDLKMKKEHVINMKDVSIGFGKRFNSYKFYFLLRKLGAEGVRIYLRQKIKLGKLFEERLLNLKCFEILEKNRFGVICFKGIFGKNNEKDTELNKKLLEEVNKDNASGMIGSVIIGKEFSLRVSINNDGTKEKHIEKIVEKIKKCYLLVNST